MTNLPHIRRFRNRSLLSYTALAAMGGAEAASPSWRPLEDPDREEIRRRRCRILVVDDEDGFRTALCAKLRRIYQAVVMEASGAHDALRAAQMHPELQLILLDISMPEMNGTEVCQQMRAAGVRTRIVLMSAHDNSENRARAEALGVRLLAKPLEEAALRQVLLECE